jgi:hypothetical protein
MKSVTLLAALLTLALPAAATGVREEVKRAVRDAGSLATQPLRWKAPQWKKFGAGALAVGALYAADEEIDRRVQANRNDDSDDIAGFITPFGGHRAMEMSFVLIASGALARNDRLFAAGRDSLLSELWAAGVVTPLMKRGFARSRPNLDVGAHEFNPGTAGKEFESFPSGHSTNAFAFATAVAGHFDGWLVPTLVYTMASGVAVARVHDRAHFASDVLAGALIGRAVAKGVVARRAEWKVTPIRTSEGTGVLLRISWQ